MYATHLKKSASLSGPSSLSLLQPNTHLQVSAYRSSKLELHVYSPSVKVEKSNRIGGSLVPVFSDNDKLEGKVVLDPSCHHSGVVSITVEGALHYDIASVSGTDSGKTPRANGRHVFLSASTTIAVSPHLPARPTTPFRGAFRTRQLSASSLTALSAPAQRTYPFSIAFPCVEALPPTLPPFAKIGSSTSEEFEISYNVIASWQPYDTSVDSAAKLEIPIHFEPEDNCRLAYFPHSRNSWMEMPLRSDRPVSYRCAVTLPASITFQRGSPLPFFVVFTTTPKSGALAKEIAADATVSVSLLRKITMADQVILPPSPPATPISAATDESDSSSSNKSKILKHVRSINFRPKTPQKMAPDPCQSPVAFFESPQSLVFREKPLPRLPTQTVLLDTQTIGMDVSIGFPKRPRHPLDNRKHPTLEEMAALPDGLYRSKFDLENKLLPSVDVAGLSVKYYLDVSVSFDQDDLRARIPIRVV